MKIKTNAVVSDKFLSDQGKEYVSFLDELGGTFKLGLPGQTDLKPLEPVVVDCEVKCGISKNGGQFLTFVSGNIGRAK